MIRQNINWVVAIVDSWTHEDERRMRRTHDQMPNISNVDHNLGKQLFVNEKSPFPTQGNIEMATRKDCLEMENPMQLSC